MNAAYYKFLVIAQFIITDVHCTKFTDTKIGNKIFIYTGSSMFFSFPIPIIMKKQ